MRLHDTNPPPLPHFELLCNNKLEVLETSESEVLKLLSKINILKSSGSDGLNNNILCEGQNGAMQMFFVKHTSYNLHGHFLNLALV
jgi:hypothetical protein